MLRPDRRRPVLATPLVVTPGDPRGVGPEVAVSALRILGWDAVVVGEGAAILREARRQGLPVTEVDAIGPGAGVRLLPVDDTAEPVEVAAVRTAVAACLEGRAAGVVTGPIHKARLAARGFPFPGHTDFLGHLCGVRDPVMAFVGLRLKVVLATVHLPLREVPGALSVPRLVHVLVTADGALARHLGLDPPRLVVCGLNPHAGDAGLLGHEEIDVVAPACEAARTRGLTVEGPVPAETAVRRVLDGRADVMVALYHDQGLVPLKALEFGHAVNWTLGLPIVRTSVDHGTADDIAGQGRADAGSMVAALRLARRLAGV